MYGCINYFELFKVNEDNEPIDAIKLTEHYMDQDSEDYNRYYITDIETYDKLHEWIESTFDRETTIKSLENLND